MNLAKSYEALGDYKKACEAYSHALRSRPFWTDAITDYSHLLVKLNRVNDAKTLVTRACSANPRDEKLKACLDYVEQFVVITGNNSSEQNQPAAEEEKDEIKEEVEEVQTPAEEAEPEELPQREAEQEEAENIEEEVPEEAVEDEADLEDLKQENEEYFDFDAFGQDEGEEEPLIEEEPEESLEEPLTEDEDLAEDAEEAENNSSGSGTESESGEGELESTEETPEAETEGGEEAAEDIAAASESCDAANLEPAEAEEPALLEIEAEDFNPFAEFCTDTDSEPSEVEEITGDESSIELSADTENTDPKLSLFIKLRQLLKYLPEEKLLEYQSSEARLMLDYLVLHLSGHKGLLQTAFELKDSENDGQIEETLQEENDNNDSFKH